MALDPLDPWHKPGAECRERNAAEAKPRVAGCKHRRRRSERNEAQGWRISNGIPIYKIQKIGEYVPDLIVFDKIVVDAKVIERITDHEKGQILNYLKITGLKVGLVLNFKHAKLEWKRFVL